MDNFDTKTPAQPATNGLQAQVEGLRHLIVSILILVVKWLFDYDVKKEYLLYI